MQPPRISGSAADSKGALLPDHLLAESDSIKYHDNNVFVADVDGDQPENESDDDTDDQGTRVAPPKYTSWRFNLISLFVITGWCVILARLIQVQGAQA